MISSSYAIYFKGFKKKGLLLRTMGIATIGESYWYDIKLGKLRGAVTTLHYLFSAL